MQMRDWMEDMAGKSQTERVMLAAMDSARPHAVASLPAAFILVGTVDLEGVDAPRIQHTADSAMGSVAVHDLHQHGLAANLAETFLLIGEPQHSLRPSMHDRRQHSQGSIPSLTLHSQRLPPAEHRPAFPFTCGCFSLPCSRGRRYAPASL